MTMTKEQIEDRVKTLTAEKEQLTANLLAYDGALQDCGYWLEQLNKADEPTQE